MSTRMMTDKERAILSPEVEILQRLRGQRAEQEERVNRLLAVLFPDATSVDIANGTVTIEHPPKEE